MTTTLDLKELLETPRKTIEQLLREVDYEGIDFYSPSDFALNFVNFIKLIGHTENATPPIHFKMVDKMMTPAEGLDPEDVINLCFRGAAKSTVLEYLILYIATVEKIPGLGKVLHAIYVSDSMDNGVKKMRQALEMRWQNSDYLQQVLPKTKFTDARWYFENANGAIFVVNGYGAKALSLDSILYTREGTTTIGECKVGDTIYGADGRLCNITAKSEVFFKPMYELKLRDGRKLKVSEDHINPVLVKDINTREKTSVNLTTKELLSLPLQHIRDRKTYTSKEDLIFVPNCAPVDFPEQNLPIDPYTLGVILGDGRINKKYGTVELTSHVDDFPHYRKEIPYEFGSLRTDKRNTNVQTQSILNIGHHLVAMALNVHGNFKFIPETYKRGSIQQRLAILQGLMDTDGTVGYRKHNPTTSFCSNSLQLVQDVMDIVYSLGGYCILGRTGKTAHRVQIHLNMSIFRLKRKRTQQKMTKRNYVAVESITPIPMEPSQCIAVDNDEHQFIAEKFFRTHNTGIRGTRDNGSRPRLGLLDDLISDEDAESPTVIAKVEDVVSKAIEHAMHPTKRKVIWNGTPFNQRDPIYKAVESGAWRVNIFPVCEQFPCSREEFKGAWEDRFPYDAVLKSYIKAVRQGKLASFMQELMLRVMSDEEKVVLDSDIVFFDRSRVLSTASAYNCYITTDFATSDKKGADLSVIAVWFLDWNHRWLLVDGIARQQTMDKNINDLFKFVQRYRPMQVGIEVTGQQGGFIPWIEREMMQKQIYFTFASSNNSGAPGIRPTTNKMERFNVALPIIKQRKLCLPTEYMDMEIAREMKEELSYITPTGIHSRYDDCIDVINQIPLLDSYAPAGLNSSEYLDGVSSKQEVDYYSELDDHDPTELGGYSSYIV